jgi:dihydroorotate dehydrogenase electron transfer subunit
VELFYGERTASAHARFGPDEQELFDRVERYTDDGSRGTAGTVVAGLKDVVGDEDVAWYGCGPHPMLAALASTLGDHGVSGAQFSLEERMGCGFGACQACVVPNREGRTRYRLLCVEGPVVDPTEVAW